ncbi:hypothetical protein E2C01_050364 [Portunus trituberculatus]|uniref:Uncharacterized protein n=1 Tax=Portunus trituberculatus TaxID=210409 RepID=A0A5B7GG80_PORTR|nr:hypothetical protein [Portunus trituberculatus]
MASRGAGCAGSPRHMRLFSNYFHFLFSFHPGNCGGRGAGAGCPTPPPQSRDAHRPGLREGRQHEKSRYILQEAEPGRGGGRTNRAAGWVLTAQCSLTLRGDLHPGPAHPYHLGGGGGKETITRPERGFDPPTMHY